jgi:hypothetical protein
MSHIFTEAKLEQAIITLLGQHQTATGVPCYPHSVGSAITRANKAEVLLADDLQHTLGILEEEGYIEFHDLTGVGPANSAPPERLPSITAFGDLPADVDPIRLQKARNFMANTLNAYVGTLGTSSLLDRIEQTNNHGTTAPCANSTMTGTTPS